MARSQFPSAWYSRCDLFIHEFNLFIRIWLSSLVVHFYFISTNNPCRFEFDIVLPLCICFFFHFLTNKFSKSLSQEMPNKNPIYPWSKVDKTMIPASKRSCLRIYERKECYLRAYDSHSRCAVQVMCMGFLLEHNETELSYSNFVLLLQSDGSLTFHSYVQKRPDINMPCTWSVGRISLSVAFYDTWYYTVHISICILVGILIKFDYAIAIERHATNCFAFMPFKSKYSKNAIKCGWPDMPHFR